jgi:DNA-binding CsgD family transcriptional regulator/tetratricopeptide (TPR) repeat protein
MAFIARERELAALASVLQRAAGGEPSRAVVHGPVGMGSSSLLDELETRLLDVPDVVLCRGRASEARGGTAYAALSEALEKPLERVSDERLVEIAGPGAHDLSLLLPAVGRRLTDAGAAPQPPSLSAPDQRGARVQESLLGVLERLAGRGVVCLMLEDLHHADPATRDLVEALIRISRRLSLALILSYQTDRLHRGHPTWDFVGRVAANRGVQAIQLEPFTRDEMMSLVESVQGERPSLGFMAAIMEGSRGNPLLATQLVSAHTQLEGVRLSDPLSVIIDARLGRVPAPALRVLRLLSAARRPLPPEMLLEARLVGGHITRRAMDDALASGLAVSRAGLLETVHELCAEAIESLMLPDERKSLHAALAALLEDDAAEQAWHWDQALRPQEAREAHLAAAQAAEVFDPGPTCLLHYQRVLELGRPPSSTDADQAALLAAASFAAEAAGSFRRAATLIEQAIELRAGGRIERALAASSTSRFERIELGQLSERLGAYRRQSGDTLGAQAALEQALQLIPPDPTAARARALASHAQHLMLEGRFEESAVLAEEARRVAAADGADAARELAHATCTLGVDVAYLGQYERGLQLLEEATELSRVAGRLDDLVRSYANRTTLLDLDSRREEALAVVNEGIREAARGGLGLTYGAFLRGNAADILFQLGRWPEAERECRAALEFPPAGVAWFSPVLYLSLVLVESRADDEAARLVGMTLLDLESVPAGQWTALVQRAAVSLALWRGDVHDARLVAAREWDRVVETADAGQIAASASTVLEACAASADAGRQRRDWSAIAESGALAERVLPFAEQQVAASPLRRSLGARREAELHLAMARAHANRLRGRSQPDEWSHLAEAWQAIPIPYQAAKARWWQAAAALETRARRPEARDALHQAWQIAAGLPARPLRLALAALAQRGRIPLPDDGPVAIPVVNEQRVPIGPGPAIAQRLLVHDRARTTDRFGLSPRESAVLIVLAEGRTNREIAERLFISERTVAVHVRRILSKLGVAGRVEAAGLAIRLGMVPQDPLLEELLAGAPRR